MMEAKASTDLTAIRERHWRYDERCEVTPEDHPEGEACQPLLPHSHRRGSIKWARLTGTRTPRRSEWLADTLMDLRMDGPAAEGWTYQQTMRHYAERIIAALDAQPVGLAQAIRAALNELGVPDENYPAPVANAVDILRAALASGSGDE